MEVDLGAFFAKNLPSIINTIAISFLLYNTIVNLFLKIKQKNYYFANLYFWVSLLLIPRPIFYIGFMFFEFQRGVQGIWLISWPSIPLWITLGLILANGRQESTLHQETKELIEEVLR